MNIPSYKKDDTINWSLDTKRCIKIRLHIKEEGEDSFAESPWAFYDESTPEKMVLANHALILTPFPSWGMVMKKSDNTDMLEFYNQENPVIMLHPEAWDAYIENEKITSDGELLMVIKKSKKENVSEELLGFQIELVWNREFHWSKFGDPKATLEEAKQSGESITNSGDGARVKKYRVINLDTGMEVWDGYKEVEREPKY